MMRSFLTTILLLTLVCVSVFSAPHAVATEKKYEVGDGMCLYSITFDNEKTNETQFRNTVAMIYGGEGSSIFSLQPSPRMLGKEVSQATIGEFSKLCLARLAKLEKLELLPLPGAERMIRSKIEQAAQWCEYETILSRALAMRADPAILYEFKPSAGQCGNFVTELKSKETLREFWKDLVAENCKKNADPTRCVSHRLADENLPDADEAIRKYVLTFGWNNCSTKFLSVNKDRSSIATASEDLKREFRAQFHVDEKCDTD